MFPAQPSGMDRIRASSDCPAAGRGRRHHCSARSGQRWSLRSWAGGWRRSHFAWPGCHRSCWATVPRMWAMHPRSVLNGCAARSEEREEEMMYSYWFTMHVHQLCKFTVTGVALAILGAWTKESSLFTFTFVCAHRLCNCSAHLVFVY